MSDSKKQYSWKNASPILYTDGVEIFAADMTPEVASDLLGHNPKNRKISDRNVDRITRQIQNGEWCFNGEAVRITGDGTLIDGQHRALACIAADREIRVLVVHGVPSEVQDTIDTGKSRTLPDLLAIRGYSNVALLSVILRSVYTRDNSPNLEDAFIMAGGNPERMRWTNAELLAFLSLEEDRILDLIKVSTQRADKIPHMPKSTAAVLIEVFEEASDEDADEFWYRLTTGVADSPNDPCLILRKTLQREADRHDRSGRSNVWIAAITIKAWNAYLQGRTLSHLRMIRGGVKPEQFPLVLTRE
jgi:hypothetical protein